MNAGQFILISPATRGLSLALTRHYLRTTKLPVFATHRSSTPESVHKHILEPLSDINPDRLTLLRLELTSEDSIASAAETLAASLPEGVDSRLHTAFFTGGILHPERQPADLDVKLMQDTFQINVLSHLLMLKHFSRFLPAPSSHAGTPLAKWVHVSARVGSISDNHIGGWYSYRAAKAALNQVIRTFDLHLQSRRVPAICVGVHPGTMKTDLSREFWGSVEKGKLFEPEYAAERLAEVVEKLREDQRGRVWDWAGLEVAP